MGDCAAASLDQRIVVYSHVEQPEVILQCLDLAAVTYLAKTEGSNHLIDAISSG